MNIWAKPVAATVGSLTTGTSRTFTVALDKPTPSSRTIHLCSAGPVVGALRDVEAAVSAEGETVPANGRTIILSVGDTTTKIELKSTLVQEMRHVWVLPFDTVGDLDSLFRSWLSEALVVYCRRKSSCGARAILTEECQ